MDNRRVYDSRPAPSPQAAAKGAMRAVKLVVALLRARKGATEPLKRRRNSRLGAIASYACRHLTRRSATSDGPSATPNATSVRVWWRTWFVKAYCDKKHKRQIAGAATYVAQFDLCLGRAGHGGIWWRCLRKS